VIWGEYEWTPMNGGLSGREVLLGSQGGRPVLVKKAIAPPVPWIVERRTFWETKLPWIPAVLNRFWTAGQWWEITLFCDGQPAVELSQGQADAVATALGQFHALSIPFAKHTTQPLLDRVAFVQSQTAEVIGEIPEGNHIAIPIHGDLHRGHVLFVQNKIEGVIDWSSVKFDHPAVDYARYFQDDVRALHVYHAAGGPRCVTVELVRYLHRVIQLGAAAYWQKRGSVPLHFER
jgi:hypothetical protein